MGSPDSTTSNAVVGVSDPHLDMTFSRESYPDKPHERENKMANFTVSRSLENARIFSQEVIRVARDTLNNTGSLETFGHDLARRDVLGYAGMSSITRARLADVFVRFDHNHIERKQILDAVMLLVAYQHNAADIVRNVRDIYAVSHSDEMMDFRCVTTVLWDELVPLDFPGDFVSEFVHVLLWDVLPPNGKYPSDDEYELIVDTLRSRTNSIFEATRPMFKSHTA